MYKSISEHFEETAPLATLYNEPNEPQTEERFFRLLADYGMPLNPPQQQAVKTTEGPVLVLAGAGSGKTTVLTNRVAYMLQVKQINPASILLMTFTRKASTEMIERLARIPGLDRSAVRSVVAGTYHSICLRILKAEGYTFEILSSDRRQHIIFKTILRKLKLQDSYSAETVANVISQWKNRLVRPQDIVAKDDVTKELVEVYKRYEQYKEDENLYDFDDMLIETYYLFKYNEEVLRRYQERFRYILCDEFQDTSYVQYEIIRMLAEPENNLCVVGDDYQTIYSFRSAASEYIVDFDKVYPNCQRIVLDINYRSTANIVGLGNTIIRHNKKQIHKTLQVVHPEQLSVQFSQPEDSEDEAGLILEDIKDKYQSGIPYKQMAVIYRSHSTGRSIFDKLLLANIPFVTYGNQSDSFYDQVFVRPVIALLKAIENPVDADAIIEAAPIFYISRQDMQRAIDEVAGMHYGNTPADLFYRAVNRIAEGKSGFQKTKLESSMAECKEIRSMKPALAIFTIRRGAIDYEKQLEVDGRKTLSFHKEMVIEILEELQEASRGFSSISEFLAFIQKVKDKNNEMEELRKNPHVDTVKLMTIHASKGLEFEVVYGIGWIEGIMPHKASLDTEPKEDVNLTPEEMLEEERRLAYVAITRAKRHLLLSSCKTNRNRATEPSRFLLEAMGKSRVEEQATVTVS